MGSLRKDRTGWIAQVRRQGVSKTKRFPAGSKREAEAWIAELETAIRKGTIDGVTAASKVTLSDVLVQYAESVLPRRGCTDPQAGRKELSQLRILQDSFLAPLPLNRIGPREILEWLTLRRQYVSPKTKKPLQESTIRRTFDVLTAVLDFAVTAFNLYGFENPCRKIPKSVRPKPSAKSLKRLRGDELDYFLRELRLYCDGKYEQIIQVLFCTGFRRGEVLLLSKDWVDPARGIVALPTSKTGPQERAVTPTALRLIDMIEAAPSDRMFDFHPDTITRVVRQICRRAAIMKAADGYEAGYYADAIRLHLLAPRLSAADLSHITPQSIQPEAGRLAIKHGVGARIRYKRVSKSALSYLQSLPHTGNAP